MEDEEFNYQSYEEKRKAADENMKKMEEDTRIWIESDEEVKAYMNRFKKAWSDDFVKSYPLMKARFVRYGNELGDQPEKHLIAYLESASKRLMDIQLKKLFDIMCRWDANLLKLDGIECSWDFFRWQDELENCPFITPITAEEVDLYLRYVHSDQFEDLGDVNLFHYDSYRDKEEESETMPQWFSFENLYTGNDKYLLLPMLRTPKEDFYRSLSYEEREVETEKKYESGELQRHVADNRPAISISQYADVERFVIAHESKDVLIAFRKYYNYFTDQLIREDPDDREDGWLTEQVDTIIHHLTGVKEKIPVEANADWRQGLIDAYAKYEKRKMAEAIPYAFTDYKMMRDLNIVKPQKKRYSDYPKLADSVRDQILRGRELNGEPRDFNF